MTTTRMLRLAVAQGAKRASVTALGITPGCLVWNAVLTGGSHDFVGRRGKTQVQKAGDRVTGCVFIGFAAKLALSRR